VRRRSGRCCLNRFKRFSQTSNLCPSHRSALTIRKAVVKTGRDGDVPEALGSDRLRRKTRLDAVKIEPRRRFRPPPLEPDLEVRPTLIHRPVQRTRGTRFGHSIDRAWHRLSSVNDRRRKRRQSTALFESGPIETPSSVIDPCNRERRGVARIDFGETPPPTGWICGSEFAESKASAGHPRVLNSTRNQNRWFPAAGFDNGIDELIGARLPRRAGVVKSCPGV